MKEQKLHYRFHDPNTVEATADLLLKILIEANQQKAEEAIRQAVEKDKEAVIFDT